MEKQHLNEVKRLQELAGLKEITVTKSQYVEVLVYTGYSEYGIEDQTIHDSSDNIDTFCKKLLHQKKLDFFYENMQDAQTPAERKELKKELTDTWSEFYGFYDVISSTQAFMGAGEENTRIIFSSENEWFKIIKNYPQEEWDDDLWDKWSELLD